MVLLLLSFQVTLRNAGEEAYKPELYGESITFQRTINESGTSAYLLKDENMKDVVRKSREAKEECKRVLDKFQIQVNSRLQSQILPYLPVLPLVLQVDSPIVILQQDEAKEMLNINSGDKLYKFFERSTLIKQCFDHYLAAQVILCHGVLNTPVQVEYNKAYDTLKTKARALKDLNAEYRRAMAK